MVMPTPYDNTDGGKSFTCADYRTAANYGVDLDAPEQVRCDSCFHYADADTLNKSGDCPACVDLLRSEEALAFLTAPTLAGCLSLMGVR